MTGKKWFSIFIILFLCALVMIGGLVAFVDPFFHYRSPRDYFYYRLVDQRSQNDGITRQFDYDAIITGTSMAENFRTSQFDELFGTDSVKVVYSGATYKEINDNLKASYASGHNVRYVFRTIDYSLLLEDKDAMRTDMGDYPVWLTNKNPFDDVKYLLNRDVIINYTLPAVAGFFLGKEPGITSFDEYSYTGDENEFSRAVVLMRSTLFDEPEQIYEASNDDILTVTANVDQNIVALAKEHPETTFIYFFPPYSMAYWGDVRQEGNLERYLELVKIAAYLMTECDNIHVYCFGFQTDITGNLDLYRDVAHFSPEVNEIIESEIADIENNGLNVDKWRLRITEENIDSYFADLLEMLESYDYKSLL
ncbi:MAG: hypothetical protein E7305_02455 [Butyrivibrio sp.]|nr:hypothetical protein [Butyrivibrio sp.]